MSKIKAGSFESKKVVPTKTDTSTATTTIKQVEVNPKKEIKINVMIAACGMLRDFEVFRQINEGIVNNFGELKLEGVLLLPDKISAVPDTPIIRKAIEDGLIIPIPG